MEAVGSITTRALLCFVARGIDAAHNSTARKMSRRMVPSLRVHLLPQRVYHTPTPASHLTPLRRQLRNPCSLVTAQARTITNYKYGNKLGKSFRSESHGQREVLPLAACDVCEELGFPQQQSLALWIHLRAQLNGYYSPLDSYRWLHNYSMIVLCRLLKLYSLT